MARGGIARLAESVYRPPLSSFSLLSLSLSGFSSLVRDLARRSAAERRPFDSKLRKSATSLG